MPFYKDLLFLLSGLKSNSKFKIESLFLKYP